MASRTSARDLAAMLRNPAVASRNLGLEAAADDKPAKYRNRKTPGPNGQGGERLYGSKREADFARQLMAQKRAGIIHDFLPQVSLETGTDEKGRAVRAIVDFLVIESVLPDGRFVAWLSDPKGADTLHSRAKRAALRARGLSVRLI